MGLFKLTTFANLWISEEDPYEQLSFSAYVNRIRYADLQTFPQILSSLCNRKYRGLLYYKYGQ